MKMSVETLRAFCRVGSDVEDDVLTVIGERVEREVQDYIGREFEREAGYEQSVEVIARSARLYLLTGPIVSVSSVVRVRAGVETSISSTYYALVGDLYLQHQTTWQPGRYVITGTIGYETVPADLMGVCYNVAAAYYRQTGHVTTEAGGGYNVSFRRLADTQDMVILKRYMMGETI